jgi:hypothetical protein
MPHVKAFAALNEAKESREPPWGATTAIGLKLGLVEPSPNWP